MNDFIRYSPFALNKDLALLSVIFMFSAIAYCPGILQTHFEFLTSASFTFSLALSCENAFKRKKRKPWLSFSTGLALTDFSWPILTSLYDLILCKVDIQDINLIFGSSDEIIKFVFQLKAV